MYSDQSRIENMLKMENDRLKEEMRVVQARAAKDLIEA